MVRLIDGHSTFDGLDFAMPMTIAALTSMMTRSLVAAWGRGWRCSSV